MINVVLMEEQLLVRQGVKSAFKNAPDIQLIADVGSYDDVLKLLRQNASNKIESHWPQIIVLSVKIPISVCLQTMQAIQEIDPNLKILVCTTFYEPPYPTHLLKAGAVGYITRFSQFEEMLLAIRKIASGQRYITPIIAQQIALTSIVDQEEVLSPFEMLSDREVEVMRLLLKGLKITQISEKLDLSPKTVNSYRYRVFEKLGVNNDIEMAHLALRHGIVNNEFLNGDRRT